MLDTAAFLFPAELEVVETKLRHVLIIGSCLSEAYVQHFRQHSPGTNYIHIMLNAAAVLPPLTDAVLAGLDPLESQDIGAAFMAGGASLLIATKTDIARRLGGLLAAAGAGLALTEAGIGPGAADGLTGLTPAWLADRLLHRRAPGDTQR